MDSILQSIKKLLGIDDEYKHFDDDIVMHINTVFAILKQLGVGPPEGFSIIDRGEIWSDYSPDNTLNESVKTYIYLKVKLVWLVMIFSKVILMIKFYMMH